MKFEFIEFFKPFEGISIHVRIDGIDYHYNLNSRNIHYSSLSRSQLLQTVNGLTLETSVIKLIEQNILNLKFEYYKFLEKRLQRELDTHFQIGGRFVKIKLSDICKSRLLE